jgi:hypothetical protein
MQWALPLPQAVSHVPVTADVWICDPRPVSVGFVVGTMALEQDFLQVFRCFPYQ